MANDNPTSSDQVIPAAGNPAPYLQNRELSWLDFNERVLEQGADESVPLLQRLNFISIFWSNLQEFFMVRVGSLTDLSLVKKHIVDSKSNMTPSEQLRAIYLRCHELYPAYERTFEQVRLLLNKVGVTHVRPDELTDEQRSYLAEYAEANVTPFLSPQIINARHPFPHLENGALYIVVRLDEEADNAQDQAKSEHKKKDKKGKKSKGKPAKESTKNASLSQNVGAEGTMLGLIPLPRQCARVQKPGARGATEPPTGAALLKYFVSEYGTMPVLKVSKAGYGTGKKNFEVANVVRAVLGETESKRSQIIELVCNIDDMTAEELSFAMDELFALGAFDVYFTHIGMKKSRPGVMLTCMCSEEKRKKMLRCIFKNTTTLGVREYVCNRYNLSRSMCTAETEYGPVRIKSAEGYGVKRSKCEYEDLAALARANGKTLREIEESAYENQKDKQNI